MTRPSSWLYVWIFLGALGSGLVLAPIVRRFAVRLGVVDVPSERKAHVEPVSLLGGLVIYGGAFAAAWSLVAGARAELKGFFLGGFVILVFGIQDDITPMDPWVKLLAQVASGLVLTGFGVQARLTGNDVADVVLTVAWLVALVNAFNYQDNMNGLATGLAVVSSLGFFVLAVTERQYLVAVLSVGVAGGALGFLPANFPRARIFMGDAGSMFLGFVLAFLGVRLRFLDEAQSTAVFIPALVLGVPLFDFALVTLSRARRRIGVTTAGTDHSSHRLVRLGLRSPVAVVLLWGAQALLCVAAVAVARLGGLVDAIAIAIAMVIGLSALAFFERRTVTESLPRREAA